MSTLTQFLPQTGIKSVQRGTFTIGSTDYFASVSISAVNTSKAFVLWGGAANPGGTSSFADNYYRIELDSSTSVTATRPGNTNSVIVAYQVVEFF